MTIKNLLSSGAWLIRNNQLANIFKSNDAAILIGDLCDRDSYFSNRQSIKNKKYNGWFFSTSSEIEKRTVCNSYTQRKWFGIFEELGLIEVKLKGIPPKKHFKLNEKTLQLLVDVNCLKFKELNVENLKNQLFTDCTYIKKNKDKKNKVNKKKDKSFSVADKKINGNASIKNVTTSPYFKLAKKLSNIIHTKKNIVHTTIQIKAWSEEFRKLHTVNKVDVIRQKAILKWYKKAIGGDYIPVVESGKSFREKFTKLEDAMNRKEISNNTYKSDITTGFGNSGFKLTKKSIKM